MLQTFS
nr:unnamed protein product [Callosobruchus analis]CAI5861792.1 unnamed protein product [Callosobruchus analis]